MKPLKYPSKHNFNLFLLEFQLLNVPRTKHFFALAAQTLNITPFSKMRVP